MEFSSWSGLDELAARGIRSIEPQNEPPLSDWHHKPRMFKSRGDPRSSAFTGVLMTVMGIVFTIGVVSSHTASVPIVVFLFVFMAMGLLTMGLGIKFGVFNGGYCSASPADLALIESIADPIWLVELAISYDGTTNGYDQGVVGFTDGAIYFAGNGCSFMIGPQDIDPRPEWGLSLKEGWRQPKVRLRLKSKRDLLIGFYILARPGRNPRADEDALIAAFKEFAQQGPSSAPRHYPPLSAPPRRMKM